MKYLRAIAFAIFVCVGAVSAEDLTGLWKAKGRFGPDARGPLTIQKDGSGYSADMLGRREPVRVEAGEFTFELPDRLGRFRGKLEAQNILGHWFRFGTPVYSSGSTGPVALSPVLLKPDGPNRWRGDVAPLQDDFTFFLNLAEKRPDGSLRAVLRNPEFDFGTQQGVERLVHEGSQVKLMGKRGEKEREVGVGTYDAENQVLTLVFPGRGGSYDFRQDAMGAGGQIVTVLPELDLVIAFYAGNYSSRSQRELGHIYVPQFILPAVREAGDDKSAPVVERKYTSPYGRSEDGSRVSRLK